MQETQSAYSGFYRPSKRAPWERLVEAGDYGTCLNRLLDAIMSRSPGEAIVSTRDPNVKQAS